MCFSLLSILIDLDIVLALLYVASIRVDWPSMIDNRIAERRRCRRTSANVWSDLSPALKTLIVHALGEHP